MKNSIIQHITLLLTSQDTRNTSGRLGLQLFLGDYGFLNPILAGLCYGDKLVGRVYQFATTHELPSSKPHS
ncbi:hypothetical protein ACFLUJ_01215 [Chloroflexota bacterium]